MQAKRIFTYAALIATLFGCSPYHSVESAPDEGLINTKGYKTLGFDSVSALVFQPYCLKCHSVAAGNDGQVNLETYANTFPNIKDIQSDVTSNDMPTHGGPVPDSLKNVLSTWISAGAPETSDIPIPNAAPDVTAPPTFNDVETQIFQPYCVSCHKTFTDYATVKGDIAKIQSEIEAGKMPKKAPPLSAELQTLLNTWITAGLPQ